MRITNDKVTIKEKSIFFTKIGKKGGKKTMSLYGKEYYRKIANKRWRKNRSLQNK